jgi:hypothetical protein
MHNENYSELEEIILRSVCYLCGGCLTDHNFKKKIVGSIEKATMVHVRLVKHLTAIGCSKSPYYA